MSIELQMKLSGTRVGRIVLHLATLCRDHRYIWHASGVMREVLHI